MNSSTTRPAVSDELRVTEAGCLLRFNPTMGTCYPVLGLRSCSPALRLDDVAWRTDPVALTHFVPTPKPAPAPGPDLPAEAARAEHAMGWLLAGLALLFSLTCFLTSCNG